MQMSRKIIKKYPIRFPCDWLVGHYSFNLLLALKLIAPIPNAHATGCDYTAAVYSLVNWSIIIFLILTHSMIKL